mgnify:CR=1 FL=1
MSEPRNVVLLGATGSIGGNALRILRAHPDKLRLVGASAHANGAALLQIADEFGLKQVCLTDDAAHEQALRDKPDGVEVLLGPQGLDELAAMEAANVVLVAVVGTAGLSPTLAAAPAPGDVSNARSAVGRS